jgi:hypothetical protein
LGAKNYFRTNPEMEEFNDESLGNQTSKIGRGGAGEVEGLVWGKSWNKEGLGLMQGPEHKRSRTMGGMVSPLNLTRVGLKDPDLVKPVGGQEKFASRKNSNSSLGLGLGKGPKIGSGKSLAGKQQLEKCRSLSKGSGQVYSQKYLEQHAGEKICGEKSNEGFILIGDDNPFDRDSEKLVKKAAKRGTTLTKCFDDGDNQVFLAECPHRPNNELRGHLTNPDPTNIWEMMPNSETGYKIQNKQFQSKKLLESLTRLQSVKEQMLKNSELLQCFDDYYLSVFQIQNFGSLQEIFTDFFREINENHFFIIANEKINRYSRVESIIKDFTKNIGKILWRLKIAKQDYWVENLEYLWLSLSLTIEKYVDSMKLEGQLDLLEAKTLWDQEREYLLGQIRGLQRDFGKDHAKWIEREEKLVEEIGYLKMGLESEKGAFKQLREEVEKKTDKFSMSITNGIIKNAEKFDMLWSAIDDEKRNQEYLMVNNVSKIIREAGHQNFYRQDVGTQTDLVLDSSKSRNQQVVGFGQDFLRDQNLFSVNSHPFDYVVTINNCWKETVTDPEQPGTTVQKQISRESQPGLGKKALFVQVEQFLDDACVNWAEFDPRESLMSYYLIKLREIKSGDSCIGLFAGHVMGGIGRATVSKGISKPNTPGLAAQTKSFVELTKGANIIYEYIEEDGQLEVDRIVLNKARRKSTVAIKP